ncbi:peptidase M23 [Spirochaetia bacterium]|nr:peptidase M23 [Spirochaetia bacterium]
MPFFRLIVMYNFFFAVFLLFFLTVPLLPAQEAASFPVISRLDMTDTAFKQYSEDVAEARRRIKNRERTGETAEDLAGALTVYAYKPGNREDASSSLDAFFLAARTNIPYETLATLNRLAHPDSFTASASLLLPSMPGIFIPETPETDLELLIWSGTAQEGIPITLNRDGVRERFLFIPGAGFSPTERAFFLQTGFRYPLRNYRLSSPFGPRVNPVTGNFRIHQGLDLAAPAGSEVYAVRDGEVIDMGADPVYGNYVIIEHGGNWRSLYGHLSKFETALRSRVRSGSLIGRVGSTGQSTGPHLHFELRQNGRAQDPGRLLFSK